MKFFEAFQNIIEKWNYCNNILYSMSCKNSNVYIVNRVSVFQTIAFEQILSVVVYKLDTGRRNSCSRMQCVKWVSMLKCCVHARLHVSLFVFDIAVLEITDFIFLRSYINLFFKSYVCSGRPTLKKYTLWKSYQNKILWMIGVQSLSFCSSLECTQNIHQKNYALFFYYNINLPRKTCIQTFQ